MAQDQTQAAVQERSVSVGASQPATIALYVGDLEANVTDSQLYDLFNQTGQVVSVRICRDMSTRQSLGYGYVNYSNPHDAARTLDVLNFTPLNGKPIRIMYSHRDPSLRRSGSGNIFIKNLDKAIDHKALHDTFSVFGNILSCKVASDFNGQSKGHGFVQFDNDESAQKAIEKWNGMHLNDKQVYVGPFLRKQDREAEIIKSKSNNVFVKNFSESTAEEDLQKSFREYGAITSVSVMREESGKSRCFGFVNFRNADDAARAIDALNGKIIDDKEWYVGKAKKKSEREVELQHQCEQNTKEDADKFQRANLYIKNLDDSIDGNKLKQLFSPFGTIISCKVMCDPNGIRKGSGFVAFSTPEEASRALLEMNGKLVESKPLYVAIAQRKEDRKARLQAQFSQMRPVAMAPPVRPPMPPMYPPGGPGLVPRIFHGQAPPVMIPPQPGFVVPGMRHGGDPVPNFFMPMVQPVQQGQLSSRRHGCAIQQQMVPRGRVYRCPPRRRGLPDVSMPGRGTPSVSYDTGCMPLRDDASPSQPIQFQIIHSHLTTAVEHASSPEHKRTLLGESLFPLVERLEADAAAKVTGMLLEMDQTEVLKLIESPEALKAKVAEAIDVLRDAAQQQQADNPSS